ncbi:transglutaminase (plasmid) [Sphingobium xenophagum]|jgi:transglutaminase-like putative cysteine protease|uniref:Transglutaminase n=2 Tax=Sphingomonadaceae TaxID=41297 RepID=A0A249MYS0_SPHXE|nr:MULTISPECIES: transglutaminase family protein [Sphingomonadaceae]ASY46523.1 transglutaminase [Sphingobium xenophagum]MBJ7438464.1 transglutaminase family protein [Sphingopyxis sp.]BBF72601.1 transglutaminase [Sphingomonas bisphenolicum]
MKIAIHAQLDYRFDRPTDVLLQLEAAAIPEQIIDDAHIDLSETEHFARVSAHDLIGERIWVRVGSELRVDYQATVSINRILNDCQALPAVPPHQLPGETVQYLMPSRYCPSDQFQSFVRAEFDALEGGRKVIAMRDWVHSHLSYVPGVSTSDTTAADTFIRRQGICRDYAHVLITLVRAAGIPARIASVYALGVEPQDFHAVAEVFLGGEWHLVDATGMAREAAMAKIGIGRDAADIAFLTAYGSAVLNSQSVQVQAVP